MFGFECRRRTNEALKMTNYRMRPTFLYVRCAYESPRHFAPKIRYNSNQIEFCVWVYASKKILYILSLFTCDYTIHMQTARITARPPEMFSFITRYRRATAQRGERKQHRQICWPQNTLRLRRFIPKCLRSFFSGLFQRQI